MLRVAAVSASALLTSKVGRRIGASQAQRMHQLQGGVSRSASRSDFSCLRNCRLRVAPYTRIQSSPARCVNATTQHVWRLRACRAQPHAAADSGHELKLAAQSEGPEQKAVAQRELHEARSHDCLQARAFDAREPPAQA